MNRTIPKWEYPGVEEAGSANSVRASGHSIPGARLLVGADMARNLSNRSFRWRCYEKANKQSCRPRIRPKGERATARVTVEEVGGGGTGPRDLKVSRA